MQQHHQQGVSVHARQHTWEVRCTVAILSADYHTQRVRQMSSRQSVCERCMMDRCAVVLFFTVPLENRLAAAAISQSLLQRSLHDGDVTGGRVVTSHVNLHTQRRDVRIQKQVGVPSQSKEAEL